VTGKKRKSVELFRHLVLRVLSESSLLMREVHSFYRVFVPSALTLVIFSLQIGYSRDLFVPLDPPRSGFGTIDPVNGMVFKQPVAVATPPNETNRLFIVERPGTIVVITNLAAPTRTVFLDLAHATASANLEEGLLGLEFHPGFATNGYFFIFRMTYTNTPGFTNVLHDRLSRFQVAPDNPNIADPRSEVPILSQPDYSSTHNAGDLKFGSDGYLYISLGDSDPPLSQKGEKSQLLDKGFFGGILRIDIDKKPGNLPPNPYSGGSTHYSIPRDNPFVGCTNYFGKSLDPNTLRTEYFALGLRNPWRFCFRPGTAELYCADVGNDIWEEINLITPGGNYGWPYFEGTNQYISHVPMPPAGFVQSPPILVYNQGSGTNEGYSVIGGLFYEGESLPGLNAKYVFGDYRTGHIWATAFDGKMQRLTGISKGLAAFGKDPRDNGVLMINHWDGTIRKLAYVPPESASPFPQTLSATGIFNDIANLAAKNDFLPYQINSPFWSDYAIKRRWFRLPGTEEKIGFQALGPWKWPAGTIFVKHFELEITNGLPSSRQRVETRLLVKTEEGVYGVTYKWNKAQTDAVLVPDEGAHETFSIHQEGSTRFQQWRYPARNECLHCHTKSAGFVLGANTLQLNRWARTPIGFENQISALQKTGCFQAPPDELASLQRIVSIDDPNQPLEKRVRSYLAANCAQCHNPSEGLWDYGAFRDAQLTTPLSETGLLGRGVTPNDSLASLLYLKLAFTGPNRMPPIGSTEINRIATNAVLTWIDSLPPRPWSRSDIDVLREGSTTVKNGVYEITGAGPGFRSESDSFHFLQRPFFGSGDLLGRVIKFLGQSQAEAGLALRVDTDPKSESAVLTVNPSGRVTFQVRKIRGGPYQLFSLQAQNGPVFLRLARSGLRLTGFTSPDGLVWQEVGHTEWVDTNGVMAGLVITSLNSLETATAHIDEVKVREVNLIQPAPLSSYSDPASIPLEGQLSENDFEVMRFYANGQLIHTSIDAQPLFLWTNTLPGSYTLEFEAIDASGLKVRSGPVPVTLEPIPRSAVFSGMNSSLGGSWQTNYGAAGFNLFNGTETAAQGLRITSEGSQPRALPLTWDDSRLLVNTAGGRSRSILESSSTIRLLFDSDLSIPTRITLYFMDWDRLGRVQEIVVRDSLNRKLIDQRLLTEFGNGKYLSWSFTGNIEIEIIAKGVGSAVLGGWFVDPLKPPEITLLEPSQNLTISAGNPVVLSGLIQEGSAPFDRLELTANGSLAAQFPSSPFRFEWIPRFTGNYELVLRAYDKELGVSTPRVLQVTVSARSAAASLINIDDSTQGNWKGIYGTRGWDIAISGRNLPPGTSASIDGSIDWRWEASTEDVRALQHPTLKTRSATVWQNFLTPITYRLTSIDPNPRLVSLYMVDYNSGSRRQELRITDLFGSELFKTEIKDFYGGRYYTFKIEGDVRISIITLTDNPLLSGVFFDHLGKAPEIAMVSPIESTYGAGEPITLAAVPTPDNQDVIVDFFANGDKIRTISAPPYELITTFNTGSYLLTASVIDKIGGTAVSKPVAINVVSGESPTIAIVSPHDRAIFPDNKPFEIEAYALTQNPGLEIEYFANENLLGSTLGPPFAFSAALPAGVFQLRAKATDRAGLVAYSAIVNIEIYRAQPPEFSDVSVNNGNVILKVSTTTKGPHILEASTDLHTWIPVITNYAPGPTLLFEVPASASEHSYRLSSTP
jgi:glucose/arabinose dehydrogenase